MANPFHILQEMLLYFPRWMEIRKRPQKSEGGKILRAISEEISQVDKELDAKQEAYFARNYIGKESMIMDRVEYIQVGKVSPESLVILTPERKITESFKEFEEAPKEYAYYYDGMLYFDSQNWDIVEYQIDGSTFQGTPKKQSIWNIFDEFALFTGLTREDNETNAKLFQRTLAFYRALPDSTEQGLKNLLLGRFPELNPDRIRLHTLEDSFQHERFSSSKDVLEELLRLNQDVFRTKIWGKSAWNHEFAGNDYVSHPWDDEPSFLQEGVGQNQQLEPVLTHGDADDTTNVALTSYKKSQQQVTQYVEQYPTDVPIELETYRYQEAIDPLPVNFRVLAAKPKAIDASAIRAKGYYRQNTRKAYPIHMLELNPDENEDIKQQDNLLHENHRYRVIYHPSDKLTIPKYPNYRFLPMEMTEIALKEGDELIDLRKENPLFQIEEGVLKNQNTKYFANQTHHFHEQQNFRNGVQGMEVIQPGQPGICRLHTDSRARNQYVFHHTKCRMTSLLFPNEFTTLTDGTYTETGIKISPGGKVVIEGAFTNLELDVKGSRFDCHYYEDGEPLFSGDIRDERNIRFSGEQRKVYRIEIESKDGSELHIDHYQYNAYDISFAIEKGELKTLQDMIVLPDEESNVLTWTIQGYSSHAPILEFIYVGVPLTKDMIYVVDIEAKNLPRRLHLDHQADATFFEFLEDGEVNRKIYNYSTFPYLFAEDSDHVIKINLGSFSDIRYTSEKIETAYQGNQLYEYIYLPQGEILKEVIIEAVYEQTLLNRTIDDLLNADGQPVYVDPHSRHFAILRGNDWHHQRIRQQDLWEGNVRHFDRIELHGLPEGVSTVFYTKYNQSERIQPFTEHFFDELYLQTNERVVHIANVQDQLVTFQKNRQLPELFHPKIMHSDLMVYMIDRANETESKIYFVNNNDRLPFSYGRNPLTLEVPAEIADYQIETVPYRVPHRLKRTMDLTQDFRHNHTDYDLSTFIVIPHEDYYFHYEEAEFAENVTVLENRYNKLKKAEIKEILFIQINGTVIPKTHYQLLEPSGIILWLVDDYAGQDAYVRYRHAYLKSIELKEIDQLYNKLTFNADAYELIGKFDMHNLKTGVWPIPEHLIDGDKIFIDHDNPAYSVHREGRSIIITRSKEDQAFVRPGYLYADGKEMYQYTNIYSNRSQRLHGIDLMRIPRDLHTLQLNQELSNFIPNSVMKKEALDVVHRIDFLDQTYFKNRSLIASVSACDNYHFWKTYHMDAALVPGLNDLGIRFTPTRESSYAILPLPPNPYPFISFYAEKADVAIGRDSLDESLYDKDSHLIEILPIVSRSQDSICYAELPELGRKYYIIILSEGIVDDILFAETEEDASSLATHKKVLHQRGWNVPKDRQEEKLDITLNVQAEQLIHRQTEIDSNGLLRITHSIHWGATHLHGWRWENEFRAGVYRDAQILSDSIRVQPGGVFTTPARHIPNRRSLRSITGKVNQVLLDEKKDFTLRILTAPNPNAEFYSLGESRNTNLFTLSAFNIQNYIQIEVQNDGEAPKTIENIELYGQYQVTEEEIRSSVFEFGEVTTQIFNLGKSKDYKVYRIDGIPEGIRSYVRSVQRSETQHIYSPWEEMHIVNNEITNTQVYEKQYLLQFRFRIEDPSVAFNPDAITITCKEA